MGLGRAQRIASARIAGVAAGWAAGNGDYVEVDEQTAIGMIRNISSDPAVLNNAAAHYVTDLRDQPKLDLLVACGADPAEAHRIRQQRDRQPRWDPPQAAPRQHR